MNLYSLQYIEHSFNLITYFHSILTAFIALDYQWNFLLPKPK